MYIYAPNRPNKNKVNQKKDPMGFWQNRGMPVERVHEG